MKEIKDIQNIFARWGWIIRPIIAEDGKLWIRSWDLDERAEIICRRRKLEYVGLRKYLDNEAIQRAILKKFPKATVTFLDVPAPGSAGKWNQEFATIVDLSGKSTKHQVRELQKIQEMFPQGKKKNPPVKDTVEAIFSVKSIQHEIDEVRESLDWLDWKLNEGQWEGETHFVTKRKTIVMKNVNGKVLSSEEWIEHLVSKFKKKFQQNPMQSESEWNHNLREMAFKEFQNLKGHEYEKVVKTKEEELLIRVKDNHERMELRSEKQRKKQILMELLVEKTLQGAAI